MNSRTSKKPHSAREPLAGRRQKKPKPAETGGPVHDDTLRQALEEVEHERARADAILAAIGEPVTIQDTGFRILYQNEAIRKVFGDRIGEHCYEAYEQRREVCDGCALARTFADGKVHKSERSVAADGRIMYFEVTASPLKDRAGRTVAGIEIARDVTGRKQREDLLAEQVRLLSLSADVGAALTKARTARDMLLSCCRLLVQHLDAAFARIWTVSAAGDILELQASAGMYTHIDGPHGQIPVDDRTKIGAIAARKTPHATNSVIGDPQVSNQEWAAKEGMVAFAGHPLCIEERLVGVVGLFFRHRLSKTTIQALAAIADQVALGIERLRTEERLRRSNRALRILSRCNETLVHAVSETELLRRICSLLVGPEGYRMAWVGYAVEDEAKRVRPVAQAGHDAGYLEAVEVSWDDSEKGRGPTGTAIRTGRVSLMKNIRTEADFAPWRAEALKRGYSSIAALPLQDSAARPFGAVVIYSSEADAFDGEEIKLLKELAGDLSFGIMAFRMREEHDDDRKEKQRLRQQLRQAQKLEAIGTLAGGIAHDFNNILSAIMGYTELARDEVGPRSKAGSDLAQVILAGRRATDLVRQILTFSRQAERERQPVRIQYIIKEALKLLRASIPASIEIRQEIDPQCPEILADPTEIHQVLMNLGTNAYHAMRGAGGVLELRLEPVVLEAPDCKASLPALRAGSYVRLTVRDTGCGMDKGTMEKIFDPYFTTKPKGEGTGLGLAVVYGIVKVYGGEITVRSELGHGTAFEVYFPAGEKGRPGKKEVAEQALPPGTERIMVIDDEEPLVELLQRALTRLGYRVDSFTDGEKAWQCFRERPADFDLVITDLTMPKMLGTALARKILDLRPDIPIILCTGFRETETLEEAKAIGVWELVEKPLDIAGISRLARKALDGKG